MKLIVFDLDGTLVDSAALMVESAVAACEASGVAAPSPEVIRSISGLTLELGLRRIVPEADTATINRLADNYRRAYQARVEAGPREPMFDGALDALQQLHARQDTFLAVATGKALRGATRVLALHGLADFFTSVQTPDHNPSKPHPGMIRSAMQAVGADNTSTVMIGDTNHDMEMARAAGVGAIGVDWGYHARDALVEAGADVVIGKFADLVETIDRLLGSQQHA